MKKELYIEKINIRNLAEKYGTPLYIYSFDTLSDKISQIKDGFLNKYDNVKAAYAAKAFSCKYIFDLFASNGIGIDVVSLGELYTAINAGINPADIEFNGNNKSALELEYAITRGVGTIIADNLRELSLLDHICERLGRRQDFLIRVNPVVEADTHKKISTATKDSKFGITISQILENIALIKSLKNINFKGLHFHIGSQLMDNSVHIEALKKVLDLDKVLRNSYGMNTDILNVGGGFGVSYVSADNPMNFSEYVSGLMEVIEIHYSNEGITRPTVSIEPGRFLVANAGYTLYSVGTVKNSDNTKNVIAVDGGMFENLRPMLYDSKYEIQTESSSDELFLSSVVGRCCESGDILADDLYLPKVNPGQLMVVNSTGAYGYSMSNNYNRNLVPGVVLVDGNDSKVIVKPQTLEQLIQNDVL